jgi:hypothetical protein
MYKHSAKLERSVLKTVGELAIAAQTMYCNGVCHDFSVLRQVCRKNHICIGPDETHTVDTIENRVTYQDWFVMTK